MDRYAEITKTLQIKICHCNENVVRITSKRELRGKLSELEYPSNTSKEFLTPPSDLMMVIEGYTPRGMFPVTINFDNDK